MATREPHHLFTYVEYLALERDTGAKHEWCAGQVFAMAGGTPEHARLAARVSAALVVAAERRGCEAFSSDLKVRVVATGLATYPDGAVVCGPLERDKEDPNAVVNPLLVVEVLSQSTEAYDRGDKLWHYQQIPSLRAVLLVSQDSRRLELVQRGSEGDTWSRTVAEEEGAVLVESIGLSVGVAQIYGESG